MKRKLITAAALACLAASAYGAVHMTNTVRSACIPPAVVQAWS